MRAEIPHLDGVEHRFADAGGLRMHVAEAGEGDPVLLLHGWPQHWWCWRHLIPALAPHYRVIAADLRGQGWTDAPPSGYEKEQLASDVLALLDALGLERVRLIGHDWGGWAGFLVCLRAPERVERFLALGVAHPWPNPDPRNLLSSWRFAYQLVLGAPGIGPRLIRTRPDLLIGRGLARAAETPTTFAESDLRIYTERLRDPARAEASAQLYRSFQLREQLPVALGRYRDTRLSTPTLLLNGARDAVLRPHMLEGFEPYADDMSADLVSDAGHFLAEDRPALIAQRALEFLRG